MHPWDFGPQDQRRKIFPNEIGLGVLAALFEAESRTPTREIGV